MRRDRLGRIRECVRDRRYDLTAHATEEMAEDSLDIVDVETVIVGGRIGRTEREDPRGTKYVIVGTAADGLREIGVVGRFVAVRRFLIITVYEIT
jgi:hypothetical protein